MTRRIFRRAVTFCRYLPPCETAYILKWGYRCTGMSFINFARVMLAALEGGRDATSGKVFLPQEKDQ